MQLKISAHQSGRPTANFDADFSASSVWAVGSVTLKRKAEWRFESPWSVQKREAGWTDGRWDPLSPLWVPRFVRSHPRRPARLPAVFVDPISHFVVQIINRVTQRCVQSNINEEKPCLIHCSMTKRNDLIVFRSNG